MIKKKGVKQQTYHLLADLWLQSFVLLLKFLCCFLWAASLNAQSLFHKSIPSLQLAEGLTTLSDGGYLLAGLRGNCIQMIRLSDTGDLLWVRQICPKNPGADITIRSIQVEKDSQNPGAFYLLFLKGAFSSVPDNLFNLMRFDASGALVWECQMRPEKKYGAFPPGNLLALTPNGTAWTAHSMGFTNALPDFDQTLVFKADPDGQLLLRRLFKSEEPLVAYGLQAQQDQEILIYGERGIATHAGFVLKINGSGQSIWAKQYAGLQFFRDGGYFSNGDLLLMAQYFNTFALTRLRSDGSLVWAYALADSLSLTQCRVLANDDILLAIRRPSGPLQLCRTSQPNQAAYWAKAYEACSQDVLNALETMPDGGFVLAQSGPLQTRVLRANAQGQAAPECPAWDQPLPAWTEIASNVSDFSISWSDLAFQPTEHLFALTPGLLKLQDCCPTEYPQAKFTLPDSVCAGAPIRLLSEGNDCSEDWRWEIPGAGTTTAQGHDIQDVIYNAPGDYPIVLTEISGACRDTFSAILQVRDSLKAAVFSFSDTILCPEFPFVLQPDLKGLDAWIWEDGSTAATRIWTTPSEGIYRLLLKKGLCSALDSVRVIFGDCGPTRFFVPNSFSPNGDGQNDRWEVFLSNGVEVMECQIFDRWGGLCYASTSSQAPIWDGRARGRDMPNGSYVWTLRLRNALGQEENRSGDLLLLR